MSALRDVLPRLDAIKALADKHASDSTCLAMAACCEIGTGECVPAMRDALAEARELIERAFIHCHATHAALEPSPCTSPLCLAILEALGRG